MASFLEPADPAALTLADLKCRASFLMDRHLSGATDEPVPEGSFRCLLCRREFEKGWTDAEAVAEYRRRFGDSEVPEFELCSDCDRIISADQGFPAAEGPGHD